MRQEGEPSVDEILDSIKRVMERDRAAAQATKSRSADESAENLPEPADEEEAEDILDLGVIGSAVSEDAPADPLITQSSEVPEDDGLTTDRAADAMRQSLAALAMLSEPPAKPQIVRQGETSLEGLAREMMRPMLAQWLDANLPDIVERLVKAEIARIAGKKN
ncbi:DUF2497 domain-containing protein [Aurantiacibacter gangjinensis]|uniref:Uncharacterized protein n=1 Tax=Aurantiacibacter gangjinensis TaxID=502682 RepID=A0A0G9MLH2_9SPHN|nr:DUF2497 domain-containing protein [Aurantiacibacter gangjinensis]APE27497.1 hypothetical protein BMF35_a0668 [Aurantiacibacter gangjinensis]KLE31555.1 hypothetical protein AAW01_08315 [Aurantiacibacter gangjinensis]